MENIKSTTEKFVVSILELVTLLASMISIISLKFHVFNEWVFPIDKGTLGVCILLIFITICFVLRVIGIFKENSDTKTFTDESGFYDYAEKIRQTATVSIKSIAGNVSWLTREKEKIASLRKNKSAVKISIYYEKESYQNMVKEILSYEQMGVLMHGYPKSDLLNTKAMIIDQGIEGEEKMYAIQKLEKKFKVIVCRRDSPAFAFATSFTDCFHKMKRKKIIGLSGINNIGKTTLSNLLSKHYMAGISLISDTFMSDWPSEIVATDAENIAQVCIAKQFQYFAELLLRPGPEIILFDRTPLDNYAFMSDPKANKQVSIILRETILSFSDNFDIIFLLEPDCDYIFDDTSHLLGNKRKTVAARIKKLYKPKKNITKFSIAYDKFNFQTKINTIFSAVVEEIDRVKYSK